jgi:hypothetical protein
MWNFRLAISTLCLLFAGCSSGASPVPVNDPEEPNPAPPIGTISGGVDLPTFRYIGSSAGTPFFGLVSNSTGHIVAGGIPEPSESDFGFEYFALPLDLYNFRWMYYPGDNLQVDPVTLWDGGSVSLTFDAPNYTNWDLDLDSGQLYGEAIAPYALYMHGNGEASGAVATAYRFADDPDNGFFAWFAWSAIWPFIDPGDWVDEPYLDFNNDGSTDFISNLPEREVIIGVYGFNDTGVVGDTYLVYGEATAPYMPTLGNPEDSIDEVTPVRIDVDFSNPTVRYR